jgi:hypothetical protein
VISRGENTDSSEEDPIDFFQVLATEKKKRGVRHSNLPEMQSPIHPPTPLTPPALVPAESSPPVPVSSPAAPTTTTSTTAPAPPQTALQYRYQSTAEDQRLISELKSWLMEGKLALTTPAHILAASPSI